MREKKREKREMLGCPSKEPFKDPLKERSRTVLRKP
jgi:hypothetical protein